MWDLPGLGLEPVSRALAGGFSTTVPPGKPHISLFKKKMVSSFRAAQRGQMKPQLFIVAFTVGSYLMFHGFLSNHKIQVCVLFLEYSTYLICMYLFIYFGCSGS